MNSSLKEGKMREQSGRVPKLKYEVMEEITRELGADCAMLFQYYYNKGQEFEYRLAEISKTLGWSVSKVERIRTKLKKADWLLWFTAGPMNITLMGKEKIAEWRLDQAMKSSA